MRLEWTSRVYCARFLLKALSSVRLDQIVQGFQWAEFKNPQGRRLRNFSQQPVPPLGCPHGKRVFSYIWSESLFSVSLFCVVLLLCLATFSAELHHSLNYIFISSRSSFPILNPMRFLLTHSSSPSCMAVLPLSILTSSLFSPPVWCHPQEG